MSLANTVENETLLSSPSFAYEDDDIIQLVTFCLGDEEFGVNIIIVSEIIRLVQITPVPHAPDFILGVINLRGRVLPVMGLRKRFGLQCVDYTEKTRIIVTIWHNQLIGFLVDSVQEVLRVPSSTVVPPPPIFSGIGSEFIDGIGKLDERLLILLNMDTLMADSQAELL